MTIKAALTSALLLVTLNPEGLIAGEIKLVRTFKTWEGGIIRSTDPAGIGYHSPTGRLLISDSEINEIENIWNCENVFEASLAGEEVFATHDSYDPDGLSCPPVSNSGDREPTGIVYNSFDGFFYITDDNHHALMRYDSSFGAPLDFILLPDEDVEGITCDPSTGYLYVIIGLGQKVLVYDSDFQFISSFSVEDEATCPEGIAYHAISQTLFIVSDPDNEIFEYTLTGEFVDKYDLDDFSPRPRSPQGLTFAPSSDPDDHPGRLSLYIVDGQVDNSADGIVYEATIPSHEVVVPTITHEETQTGTASDTVVVATSASLAAVEGHLYLAAIASNENVAVSSVTGLELPWQFLMSQCAAGNRGGLEVWYAHGDPADADEVIAVFDGEPDNAVIAVSRYSGVDDSGPIGERFAINANAMHGLDADCSIRTKSADYSFGLTITENEAWIYSAATSLLNTRHKPDSAFIERVELAAGSGKEQARLAIQDRRVAAASVVSVDGSFEKITEWAVIGLEIKPGNTAQKMAMQFGSQAREETIASRSLNQQLRWQENLEQETSMPPQSFALYASYPNPFRSATRLEYAVPRPTEIKLIVYDLQGRQVRKLIDGYRSPGYGSTFWNGRDDAGRKVGTGLYFIRLEAERLKITRRALLRR